MKKFFCLFFSFLWVFNLLCLPEITKVKTAKIDALRKRISPETGFVFDLDGTLVDYTNDVDDDALAIGFIEGEKTKKLLEAAAASAQWAIGWTARHSRAAATTGEQFEQLGFDFNTGLTTSPNGSFSLNQGIIYGRDKATQLVEFLKALEAIPKVLVVIDDVENNLDLVSEKVAALEGIESVWLYHYKGKIKKDPISCWPF